MRKWISLGFVLLLWSACNSKPETIFHDAEVSWSEGKIQKAVSRYDRLVQKYPDSPLADFAFFRLGEAYHLNLGDEMAALKYFKEVADRGKDRNLKFRANLYMAEIFSQSLRKFDFAIVQYQKLIDEFGDPKTDDDYQFKIAECYFRKGDYRQAIVEFQLLLERYPDSDLVMETQYQIANCYFVTGDCDRAAGLFQAALDNFPSNPHEVDIRYGIGSCLEEQGNYAEALRMYREIRDRYPNRKLLDLKIDSLKKRL